MKISSDIDIDVGDRDTVLSLIQHIPASIRKNNSVKKHPTGVYVTKIPYDPIHDMSSLDYEDAEKRGYFKLDILNVHVYKLVRDDQHLYQLMNEPNWNNLKQKKFVEQLIHINNQYDVLKSMPEPIDDINKLAMFLAIIRPGKRHLIGKAYNEIEKTVWEKTVDNYYFKKSHSYSYAQLVIVHMNLIDELGNFFD